MIVQFFTHGTGPAKSAINYLLGVNDGEGKKRDPPAEIFYGDPEITKLLIDNSQRKFKYTSGVISFRNDEKPTYKELTQIIKSMYENFCPELGPEKVNMLIVRHEDKGNTELHIVIPTVEISTMKRFNICPPGKHTQQLSKDFSALWNHKLGYSQVVEDPLKVSLHKFDAKVPLGDRKKKIKERASHEISKLIRHGVISNRDDLCDYLVAKKIEITRKGQDYISVKFLGEKKATRLYGPIYSKNSDYKSLVKQADDVLNNTRLNDFEVSNVKQRLETSVQYRRDFNKKTYTIKKRIPKGSKLYSSKPKLERTVKNTLPVKMDRGPDMLPTTDKSTFSSKVDSNPQTKLKKSLGATESPSTKVNSSGASTSIKKSLAGVQAQITSAIADLSNAKTPEEKANAEQKLCELMAQKTKLEYELMEAEKAELNRGPRPK